MSERGGDPDPTPNKQYPDSNSEVILSGGAMNTGEEIQKKTASTDKAEEMKGSQKINELKENVEKLDKQLREFQNNAKVSEDERKELQKELEDTKTKLKEAELKYKKEKEAKEQLLNRLSEVAGAKLSENNAAITDLSDVNRPQKLGEMFSEIYDNEWTDAYDVLKQTYGDERQVITELLKILQDCNKHCIRKAEELLDGFYVVVRKVAFADFEDQSKTSALPGTSSKKIKDFRKSLGPELLPDIKKVYVQQRESEKERAKEKREALTKYTTKCLQFCWYAAIQDPSVFIEFMENHNDAPFDSDRLREYTKKGDVIDFVVWPVLYLFKDGALLSKGVAQGKSKTEVKKESNKKPVTVTDSKIEPERKEIKEAKSIKPHTDITKDQTKSDVRPNLTSESNIKEVETTSQEEKTNALKSSEKQDILDDKSNVTTKEEPVRTSWTGNVNKIDVTKGGSPTHVLRKVKNPEEKGARQISTVNLPTK